MAKPGTFQPGPDPRRANVGLPRGYKAFRKACRAHSPRAIEVLAEALASSDERLRVEAAKILLERAWGKTPIAPEDARREAANADTQRRLAGWSDEKLDAVSKGHPIQ